MSIQTHSFTVEYNGLTLVPTTGIKISEAHDPKTGPAPTPMEFSCIWDTGASHSVITQKVVNSLGLKPVSKRKSNTGNGDIIADVFLVNLILPSNVTIIGAQVSCLPINGPDALIGMDIIHRGDFAITGKNGITKLSFQMPSTHDIDFVKESQTASATHHIGRNDPCFCKSGKKYKNCHGKNI